MAELSFKAWNTFGTNLPLRTNYQKSLLKLVVMKKITHLMFVCFFLSFSCARIDIRRMLFHRAVMLVDLLRKPPTLFLISYLHSGFSPVFPSHPFSNQSPTASIVKARGIGTGERMRETSKPIHQTWLTTNSHRIHRQNALVRELQSYQLYQFLSLNKE